MALIDNIRAAYKFDNGAITTDSSGNGYTLTNTNTVAGTASGKIGYGTDYGTTNTNKSLSVANNMTIDGGAMSMSLWVKVRTELSTNGQRYTFIIQESAASDVKYEIYYEQRSDGNGIRLAFNRQSFFSYVFYKENYELGTSNWYHLVLTYNGSNTLTAYINGTSQGTKATETNTASGMSDYVSIGYDVLSNNYWSPVYMDEVYIWNKELSSTEVTALYNSGNGLQYPFTTTSIKSFNGLAKASIKSINGLAIGSVKSVNGLA
jgi:hypothetical protein